MGASLRMKKAEGQVNLTCPSAFFILKRGVEAIASGYAPESIG